MILKQQTSGEIKLPGLGPSLCLIPRQVAWVEGNRRSLNYALANNARSMAKGVIPALTNPFGETVAPAQAVARETVDWARPELLSSGSSSLFAESA